MHGATIKILGKHFL